MHRWITRFFALMTLGPVALWAACALAVASLRGVYGCRIDAAGIHPCDLHGLAAGETAAMLGILASQGPMIFGPLVLLSAAAWGLYALIRRLRRGAR